jgi:hypothetical protein
MVGYRAILRSKSRVKIPILSKYYCLLQNAHNQKAIDRIRKTLLYLITPITAKIVRLF